MHTGYRHSTFLQEARVFFILHRSLLNSPSHWLAARRKEEEDQFKREKEKDGVRERERERESILPLTTAIKHLLQDTSLSTFSCLCCNREDRLDCSVPTFYVQSAVASDEEPNHCLGCVATLPTGLLVCGRFSVSHGGFVSIKISKKCIVKVLFGFYGYCQGVVWFPW